MRGRCSARDAGAVVARPRARRRRRPRAALTTSRARRSGVYLMALSTRFSRIRRSRSRVGRHYGRRRRRCARARSDLRAAGPGERCATTSAAISPGSDAPPTAAAAHPTPAATAPSRSSTRAAMRSACGADLARGSAARHGLRHGPVLQGLHEAADRGQGRAQLVGGVGDEVAADPLQAPALRHVVEAQDRAVGDALGPGKGHAREREGPPQDAAAPPPRPAARRSSAPPAATSPTSRCRMTST